MTLNRSPVASRGASILLIHIGFGKFPFGSIIRRRQVFRAHQEYITSQRYPLGYTGLPLRSKDSWIKSYSWAAFALAYIDDNIIFHHTWEDHLTHLQDVLLQLQEYRLTANPNKCHIGWVQVNLGGYIVGWSQLRAQPNEVQALKQAQRPVNKKDLQHLEREGGGRLAIIGI